MTAVSESNGDSFSDSFAESEGNTLEDDDLTEQPVVIVIDGGSNLLVPSQPDDGLVGKIYYLLNDSPNNTVSPPTMKDKNGIDILFPSEVTQVNTIIDRGIELPADLLLPNIFLPTFKFSEGFMGINGVEVKDELGNSLVEAFAFELKGYIVKGENMDTGIYEFALLSDDGATLEADLDKDGTYETMLVDNDGLHNTKMGCSLIPVDIQTDTKIPIRLRFYQGPAERIALSLLLRKIDTPDQAGLEPRCGYTHPTEWFSSEEDSTLPDLVNSIYGEINARGWFPAESSSLANK